MSATGKPTDQSTAVSILDAFNSGVTTPEAYLDTMAPAFRQAERLNAYLCGPEPFASGPIAGPLAGLPVSIKDNIAVTGAPTTGGTPAFAALSLKEGQVVASLRTAGATITGKTNLHELAFGITGANAHTGPALNPFDPTRLAGGSSSGAAVSVAVGAAAIGIGTDTGGSCRVPAAHCGVVGYRPTTGRYSGEGYIELSAARDTLGIIARSVADIVLVDGIIMHAAGTRPPIAASEVRLGAVPPGSFGMGCDDALIVGYETALSMLREHGFTIVEAHLDEAIAIDAACGFTIALYETARSLANIARIHCGLSFGQFIEAIASPDVKGLMATQTGPDAIPEAVYREALEDHLPRLRAAFASAFAASAVDALIYPTSLFLPPPVSVAETFSMAGNELPTFPAYTATTRPDSMAGQPSISLPYGTVNGLPVGLQLVGMRGDDLALFAIASTMEEALPPRPIPPRSHE